MDERSSKMDMEGGPRWHHLGTLQVFKDKQILQKQQRLDITDLGNFVQSVWHRVGQSPCHF